MNIEPQTIVIIFVGIGFCFLADRSRRNIERIRELEGWKSYLYSEIDKMKSEINYLKHPSVKP